MNPVNRRRFERFSLLPMYTPVIVRLLGENASEHEGHAYDISEGGVRFELDEPIAPGTPVSIQIVLPGDDRSNASRGVLVRGNVVWVNQDLDEPGPTKMAAAITSFARAGDRERLLNQLSSGRYARAA
jgi:hypothetical protein